MCCVSIDVFRQYIQKTIAEGVARVPHPLRKLNCEIVTVRPRSAKWNYEQLLCNDLDRNLSSASRRMYRCHRSNWGFVEKVSVYEIGIRGRTPNRADPKAPSAEVGSSCVRTIGLRRLCLPSENRSARSNQSCRGAIDGAHAQLCGLHANVCSKAGLHVLPKYNANLTPEPGRIDDLEAHEITGARQGTRRAFAQINWNSSCHHQGRSWTRHRPGQCRACGNASGSQRRTPAGSARAKVANPKVPEDLPRSATGTNVFNAGTFETTFASGTPTSGTLNVLTNGAAVGSFTKIRRDAEPDRDGNG